MIQETLEFAYKLKRDYDVTPILFNTNPIQGTSLYKLCEEKNYLVRREGKKSWFNPTKMAIRTEEFNPEYLKDKVKSFYKKILLMEIIAAIKKIM